MLAIVLRLAAIGAALSLASGCATVTQGGSQAVSIDTDPAGATCTVVRRGETLGVVNPTPGNLYVSKGFASLSLVCRKDDYQDEQHEVSSSMQGMTFGNFLIGGGLGFAIDAMSGAMRQYPSTVRLTMIPTKFASNTERDQFLADRRRRIDEDADQRITSIRKNCLTDACEREVTVIDTERKERIEALEKRIQGPQARPG